MDVSVKRTGGFAGLSEEVVRVTTEGMDAASARQVEQIVKDIKFFDLPDVVTGDAIGADLYYYEITVKEGDRQHTVKVVDDDSSETMPLRRLVDTLIKMR
jgi:hypothetical protein